MLRWILLSVSVCLAMLSTLTWVNAPTLLGWKLAILAGEFGHYLGVLAVMVAVLAWIRPSDRASFLVPVIVIVSVGSLVGFLRPTFLARKISRALPAQLSEAFGPASIARDPFELTRLGLMGVGPRAAIEGLEVPMAEGLDALPIDFYRAQTAPGLAAPCVVMVHGGGWDGGDRTQLSGLSHRLSQLGYAVAAVSYRLAPKTVWPGQRDDILRSIAYLKAEATRLGIDRSRLVLFGRSAGGQLATAVAYSAQDRSIRGVIAFYSPFDLRFAWDHSNPDDVLDSFKLLRQYMGGSPEEKSAAYAQSNAHAYLSPRTPATLLIHGQLDILVWHRHSVRLNDSLAEVGVPHYFISLPWATHGFDFNLNGPGGQISTYAVEHFLAAVTR